MKSLSRPWSFLILGILFAVLGSMVCQAGTVPTLSIDDVAGAYGSGGSLEHGDLASPATSSSLLSYNLNQTGGDGSYADANITATFGHLHAYADAHRTYNTNLGPSLPVVGNAQAQAWGQFIDYVQASSSSSVGYVNYTLTLDIHGTHSLDASPDYVQGFALAYYDIYDMTTSQTLAFDTWTSSDAVPSVKLTQKISAAQGDMLRIRVDFEADAYVMSNNTNPNDLTAFSDYSNTLGATLESTTRGANTIGLSGHNYATSVPAPATGIIWLIGLAFAALFHRRVTHSQPS